MESFLGHVDRWNEVRQARQGLQGAGGVMWDDGAHSI
jgi:hypothetical protein